MVTYTLSAVEEASMKKFNKKHYKKCDSNTSLIITETGIGVAIEIRCNKCNKIKDISDYSCW